MKILIIDDEESMRHMLSIILKKEGYDVVSTEGGRQAIKILEKEDFDFILCDIRMPGMDGIEFLKSFNTLTTGHSPPSTVVMMSAYGAIDTAIECMKLGAYDYISKPFKADEIILTLKKAEERERLKKESLRLKESQEKKYNFGNIIAKSKEMLGVFELINKVKDYNTTILLTGESGTGKELVARAIHYNGVRKDRPFVAVNCGAIPEMLIESELFGHVKGAFTDAVKTKTGLFEEADKGTIFLDEIAELPKDLQVKLLRVLQEGEIRKVGDTKSIRIDVRVIAATARNISEEIKKGTFREDLFYRLNVVNINLPPLREKKEDIPVLAEHFLKIYSDKFGKPIKGIDKNAIDAISSYQWPGNVRELENVIERAVILEDSDVIKIDSLPFMQRGSVGGYTPQHQSAAGLSIKKAEEVIEKELIKKALDATGGNKTKAAELLEISHRALLYKIKGYRLEGKG